MSLIQHIFTLTCTVLFVLLFVPMLAVGLMIFFVIATLVSPLASYNAIRKVVAMGHLS